MKRLLPILFIFLIVFITIDVAADTQSRLPNANDASNPWTPFGDTLEYQCVDEAIGAPDDDTTYAYRVNPDATQYFEYLDFAITSTSITNVSITHRSRRTATGTNNIIPRIFVNGTAYDGNTDAMTTSYTEFTSTWATNPNTGSAWLEADVEGTGSNPIQKFGVISNGLASGEEVRCTQIYMTVTYTVAGGGRQKNNN